MMKESVKKSFEKSKNVLEEKRKIVNFCIKKTHTFTIIAMNFVQEQLIIWCLGDGMLGDNSIRRAISIAIRQKKLI